MSLDPDREKSSLLAPLADEYELGEDDAGRILANIRAAHARGTGRAASSSVAGSGRKALLIGASCLALAFGGALVFAPGKKSELSAPSSAPVVTSPQADASARAPEDAPAVASIAIDDLPSVVPTSPVAARDPKKAPAAPSTSATPPESDTLERETQLITSARRALNAGHGDRALALLDEHARLFPNGWLASERAAERVVVLCELGRRAEATREAAAFLAGRSKSPLTRRVETSCAATPAPRGGE